MIERTADKSGDNRNGHESKLKVESVADSVFIVFVVGRKTEEEKLDDVLCGCSMFRDVGKTTTFDDPSFIICLGRVEGAETKHLRSVVISIQLDQDLSSCSTINKDSHE